MTLIETNIDKLDAFLLALIFLNSSLSIVYLFYIHFTLISALI